MKVDASRAQLVQADGLGHETRAVLGDHAALRLWLRLLACSTQIEDQIRRRLRLRFRPHLRPHRAQELLHGAARRLIGDTRQPPIGG